MKTKKQRRRGDVPEIKRVLGGDTMKPSQQQKRERKATEIIPPRKSRIAHADAPVSEFELAVCRRIANQLRDCNPEGLDAESLERLSGWIEAGASS